LNLGGLFARLMGKVMAGAKIPNNEMAKGEG